jgi:hypothetical protein
VQQGQQRQQNAGKDARATLVVTHVQQWGITLVQQQQQCSNSKGAGKTMA